MKFLISPPFVPVRWSRLDDDIKSRLNQLYKKYKSIGPKNLTYDQLSEFVFRDSSGYIIRDSILAAIKYKENPAFSLGTEKSTLRLISQESTNFTDGRVYDAACSIRRHLFGTVESLRDNDLSIKHLPRLRIPPPKPNDAIYLSFNDFNSDNPIWEAINLFALILVSHPFSDGNGRTGRVLVNAFLRDRVSLQAHILPLSEMLRASKGFFEEMLAKGHESGDYYSLLIFLADLIEKYVEFFFEREKELLLPFSEFILNNRNNDFRYRRFDLNKISPFTVSWVDIRTQISNSEAVFLIDRAVTKIKEFGDIEYAFSRLSVIEGKCEKKSVSFVINSNRKEELAAIFREIRYSMPELKIFEAIVKTNDPVIDAKIIINISTFYINEIYEEGDVLLLIYDF